MVATLDSVIVVACSSEKKFKDDGVSDSGRNAKFNFQRPVT
jgi:hypothetical protein